MNAVISLIERRYPLFYDLGTRRLGLVLGLFAGLYFLVAASMWANLIATSDDLFTRAGPIIGGDFIVFQHAAARADEADLAGLYEMKTLKAELMARYPGRGEMNFGWMYPPTMFLFLAPLGEAPYLAAFSIWVLAFGAIFLIVLHRLWASPRALFFAVTAPPFFQAIITGQNGLLTGALIALAGGHAKERPVLAGLAAGLLTVKPQLGLLIPVAFAAAGCWRAFFIAGATALSLAGLSVVAFGADLWLAFIDGLLAHGGRMAAEGFPFHKLVTPFGLVTMLGAPAPLSHTVQIAAALALAAYVFIVWKRVGDAGLRLAALSSAAVLATPYAFYYEVVIVLPAILLIAKRAAETHWLPGEKLSFIALFILALQAPGAASVPALSPGALAALLAFLIVARRALPAAGVRFAMTRSPAATG
ncbi:MAG: glycosyltransferase family 87 protein [Parvularculaceae bacterium]